MAQPVRSKSPAFGGKRSFLPNGSTILGGRYRILEGIVVGEGMSNVYLVNDTNLNKTWCLKEIRKKEAGRDNAELRSLLREANIMKNLNHPGIPRIAFIEEDEDSIFIIMDFVDGLSLQDLLNRKGKIDQKHAVMWADQVATILFYLHNLPNPLVYRDLKPRNVMISSDGNAKLLDFGISEFITEKGQLNKEALGTKGYAPLEQGEVGVPLDPRSDIYSFGALLYYVLTGVPPKDIRVEKKKGRLNEWKGLSPRSVDSTISMGLEEVVVRCTQASPEDRYSSVGELLVALKNFDKQDVRNRAKARKKIQIVAGLAVAGSLLVAGSFIPLMLDSRWEGQRYDSQLLAAQQTGKESDWVKAIEMRPSEVDNYFQLIDVQKKDGELSDKEERNLLNLINPNIGILKSDSQWGKLSFELGKLYWFYYKADNNGADGGKALSTKWFQSAIDSGYEVDQAKILLTSGEFSRDIASKVQEGGDGGEYKKYWTALQSVKGEGGVGELIRLQMYYTTLSCIDSYAYRLRTDGVPEEELVRKVAEIRSAVEPMNPAEGKPKEWYQKVQGVLEGIGDKISVAYGNSTGTNTDLGKPLTDRVESSDLDGVNSGEDSGKSFGEVPTDVEDPEDLKSNPENLNEGSETTEEEYVVGDEALEEGGNA